jgi:hypothetical protein
MGSKTEMVEALIGKHGRIHNGKGIETELAFSLYKYEASLYGIPRAKSARGVCRVSEGNRVLEELFNAKKPAYLSSDELEATIQLTSSGTFRMTGFSVPKN